MGNEIHVVRKLANGGQIMVSGELTEILKEYNIKAEDLWKVFSDERLCPDPVTCVGWQITRMGSASIATALCFAEVHCSGPQIRVMYRTSVKDICMCPEYGCIQLIGGLKDPGIFIKDPSILIPFEQIVKNIPKTHRKAYMQMMEEMMKE